MMDIGLIGLVVCGVVLCCWLMNCLICQLPMKYTLIALSRNIFAACMGFSTMFDNAQVVKYYWIVMSFVNHFRD